MVCVFYCWIIIPPNGLQIHWLFEMYLSCFQFLTVMNSAALFIWTVLLQNTLESPLNFKEIKPVNPKGNQPRRSHERTGAEVEAPVLRPSDAKSWLTGKDPDGGKDWRQEGKQATEDEMADGIINLMDTTLCKLWEMVRTGKPGQLQPMESQSHTQLSDRTTIHLHMRFYAVKFAFLGECLKIGLLRHT